jgi:uncharacterized membrane protein
LHFCLGAPRIKLVLIEFIILLVVLVIVSLIVAAVEIKSLLPLLLRMVIEVAGLVRGLAKQSCVLLEQRLHVLLRHRGALAVGFASDLGDL